MPIIIFSHGMRVDPTIYRPLVEELASHGHIVISLNHPASSTRASFSEDALDVNTWDQLSASETEENGKEIDDQIENIVVVEAANIKFIVDQIRNGTLLGLPQNLGNTNQIVLVGHSLGGAASIAAARENNHIVGCIDLDGRLEGPKSNRTAALQVPSLLLFTKHSPHEAADKDINDFMINNRNSTKKTIEGKHLDFTIYPFLDWVSGGEREKEGLRVHARASKEILDFISSLPG